MSNEITVQNGNNMLAPANIEQAMKLAEMMSGAKLVPVHLQGKPADCLLVIEQASRWKMSPFAVAQSTSVIQGKLMYEGKLVAAVVNANGNLTERLSYKYDGAGDNRKVLVSGRCNGEKEPRTIEVTLKDARTQNKVWASQPDQQLMYHGARVWARRHMPELMLGVYSPEEFDESTMVNVTPQVDTVDPVTGEVNKAKSFWKNATLRNAFHKDTEDKLRQAKNAAEANLVIQQVKESLDGMAKGDSRDELSLESIRNTYKLVLSRFQTPEKPKSNGVPVEDGGLTEEEMEAYAQERASLNNRLADDPPEAVRMKPSDMQY